MADVDRESVFSSESPEDGGLADEGLQDFETSERGPHEDFVAEETEGLEGKGDEVVGISTDLAEKDLTVAEQEAVELDREFPTAPITPIMERLPAIVAPPPGIAVGRPIIPASFLGGLPMTAGSDLPSMPGSEGARVPQPTIFASLSPHGAVDFAPFAEPASMTSAPTTPLIVKGVRSSVEPASPQGGAKSLIPLSGISKPVTVGIRRLPALGKPIKVEAVVKPPVETKAPLQIKKPLPAKAVPAKVVGIPQIRPTLPRIPIAPLPKSKPEKLESPKSTEEEEEEEKSADEVLRSYTELLRQDRNEPLHIFKFRSRLAEILDSVPLKEIGVDLKLSAETVIQLSRVLLNYYWYGVRYASPLQRVIDTLIEITPDLQDLIP